MIAEGGGLIMSYSNNGGYGNGSDPYSYIGSEAHMRSLQDEIHRNQNAAAQQANQSYANGRREGWDAAVREANAVIALRKTDIANLEHANRLQAERIAYLEAECVAIKKDGDETIERWSVHSDKIKALASERAVEITRLTIVNKELSERLSSLLESLQSSEL